MELILIRHGEPAWVNAGGTPDMDPPLTKRGHEQARLVAERLASDRRQIAELIVSPAARARETADPISRMTRVKPKVIDDLVEFQLPDWSNLTPVEVAANFRAMRERHPESWWEGAPGGESFHDFEKRVDAAIHELLRARGVEHAESGKRNVWKQSKDPGRIVVVAHGGTNSLIMSLLLGMETVPWIWERISLHHASIIRLRTVPLGGATIMSLRAHNDIEHLPKEVRTK